MGSRAVVLVRRDATRRHPHAYGPIVLRRRRSSRPLLAACARAADSAGLWDELGTDWVLLDTEIMPWSAKAIELIRSQYAASARPPGPPCRRLSTRCTWPPPAASTSTDCSTRTAQRAADAEAFTAVYRRYSWPIDGAEGRPHRAVPGARERGHDVRDPGPRVAPRPRRPARRRRPRAVHDDASTGRRHRRRGVRRRRGRLVGRADGRRRRGDGGQAAANLVRGPKGLVQPGVKVRGREYLRHHLRPRLHDPGQPLAAPQPQPGPQAVDGAARVRAGLEALRRLATGEPVWRVHECVFAILAMESEPVDPRL